MSLRNVWYSFLSSCLLAASFLGGSWLYRHWNDPDMEIVLVNFFVACIPFLVTLFVWFVPDLRKVRMAWRVAIMGLGLIFSLLVARQQVLTLRASKADQLVALKAVDKSVEHTDRQISRVENQLQDSTTKINDRLNTLSGQVSKSETDLNGSISKVGVPVPKYAQLQFSFWSEDASKMPLVANTVTPDLEGVLSVDFTVTNISDTAATQVDLWVVLCDQCLFAKEPEGFDRPKGTNERIRHKLLVLLNPGVSLEKTTLDVKTTGFYSLVLLAFKYSCTTCGNSPPAQTLKVFTNQALLPHPLSSLR
jgi:hypothetical protein